MLRNLFRKKNKSNIANNDIYGDFDPSDWEIINSVKPYTMTSIERLKSLIDSVKYVTDNKIDGDFVECGTWKGGSVMCMQKKMLSLDKTNRVFWVFDTFEGMPKPQEIDTNFRHTLAQKILDNEEKENSLTWAYSNYDQTTKNILSSGYPQNKINFVKGLVEETIPITKIDKIAILRLDTDWYSSTKIELEYLYPKLARGGIMIIDDYGHWEGCKKAVDEYFENNNIAVYMNRIDYTSRLIVKPF
jgi:hypothetical protein